MNKHKSTACLLGPKSKQIFIEDYSGLYENKQQPINNIPLMPSFIKEDKISKLLYSKFLVKGVKPLHTVAVQSKLHKGAKKQQKPLFQNDTTTNTKQVIVKQYQNKKPRKQSKATIFQDQQIFDHSVDQFFRMKSHRTLQKKGENEQSYKKDYKRPQSAIQKASSHKIFERPLTANQNHKSSLQKHQNLISRPQTASSIHKIPTFPKQKMDFQGLNVNSNLLTITSDDFLLKKVDFIEKNKKQISSKKSSIYITNFIEQTQSKKQRLQEKKVNQMDTLECNFNKVQLTKKQKQNFTLKEQQYLHYMKTAMPDQYKKCLHFLQTIQNQQRQDKNLLVSHYGYQDDLSQPKSQIQEESVKQFYQNFYKICQNTEYSIKEKIKYFQCEPKFKKIMNINQCECLLKLYTEMVSLKLQNKDYQTINNKILSLVKHLQFFSELESSILKQIFEINYQIHQIEQNIDIINQGDLVDKIHVILNGSVTRKNAKTQEQNFRYGQVTLPNFLITQFDGQVFGIPNKMQETVLNYSIRTIQKCLLFTIPFKQYKLLLSTTSNIQDRIQVLKIALLSDINGDSLANEDLEAIAYQMETLNFHARDIIFRKGDLCDKLIILAGGKVNLCLESIINRKKIKNKSFQSSNNFSNNKYTLKDMRRNNLVNYELICQNSNEITYYYQQTYDQKIRGDSLNWNNFLSGNRQCQINYSIISSNNLTRIYTLSTDKVERFSDHIRRFLYKKSQRQANKFKFDGQKDNILKWDNFKQKICNQIIRRKKNI